MASTKTPRELETIAFEDQAAWERWLAEHHASSPGIWMKLAKKATGVASVTYHEALDVALCYGWIDGQKRSFDDGAWLQKFTPRAPRSKWSKVNQQKVAQLIASGRMREAGLAEIERAKANGQWDAAYDPASTATVPAELQAALDASPAAAAAFGQLKSSERYSILYRLQTAKRAETKARLVAQFIAQLEQGDESATS